MLFHGSLVLTIVVSLGSCFPNPFGSPKLPSVPALPNPSLPNVDAVVPAVTSVTGGGVLAKLTALLRFLGILSSPITDLKNSLTGALPGALTGAVSGVLPGAVSGVLPGAVSGVLPGAVSGVLPGAVSGVLPGAVSGVLPGAVSGVLPGAVSGVLPGAVSGVLPGALTGALPGSLSGVNDVLAKKPSLPTINGPDVPAVGGSSTTLEDLNRRISRLEAVLKLEGRIQMVGEKMIATSGKEVDFATSNSTCYGVGGRIVTPMNEAENNAALVFVKKYNRYAYMGMREGPIPGSFNYMNGVPAVYTRWRKGEPSGKGAEGCVEMYTDGQWNDKACNQNRLTVCEL